MGQPVRFEKDGSLGRASGGSSPDAREMARRVLLAFSAAGAGFGMYVVTEMSVTMAVLSAVAVFFGILVALLLPFSFSGASTDGPGNTAEARELLTRTNTLIVRLRLAAGTIRNQEAAKSVRKITDGVSGAVMRAGGNWGRIEAETRRAIAYSLPEVVKIVETLIEAERRQPPQKVDARQAFGALLKIEGQFEHLFAPVGGTDLVKGRRK